MFFLDFGSVALVGASPEKHVSPEPRPAGGAEAHRRHTPRSADPGATTALAAELEADEKERPSHLMLVDLARNDLSRVCEPGQRATHEALEVERYSHVMHLVSNVEGQLSPGEDAFSLLRGHVPAGTVSGAPKVRAMQIISALEPHRRGIYAGAVGYVGFGGEMDTCIALRTIVMRGGVAELQAGAGIVADSVPESEHQECLNKLGALRQAVDVAEQGRYGR
jgi:anthranilate synthase component 1